MPLNFEGGRATTSTTTTTVHHPQGADFFKQAAQRPIDNSEFRWLNTPDWKEKAPSKGSSCVHASAATAKSPRDVSGKSRRSCQGCPGMRCPSAASVLRRKGLAAASSSATPGPSICQHESSSLVRFSTSSRAGSSENANSSPQSSLNAWRNAGAGTGFGASSSGRPQGIRIPISSKDQAFTQPFLGNGKPSSAVKVEQAQKRPSGRQGGKGPAKAQPRTSEASIVAQGASQKPIPATLDQVRATEQDRVRGPTTAPDSHGAPGGPQVPRRSSASVQEQDETPTQSEFTWQELPPRPPLSNPAPSTLQASYAYSSPTAYDPKEDFELPSEVSLLEETATRATARQSARAHVSVIIDGDNLLFRKDLINEGFAGGVKAARRVRSYVLDNLQGSPIAAITTSSMDVRAAIVCNLVQLRSILETRGGVRKGAFDEFYLGWLKGGPFFGFVDAGKGKQVADIRVRAQLVDSVLDSDCAHIFFGGLQDLGYANELVGLRKLGLLQKISLLGAPEYILKSKTYKEYADRVRDWSDVFSEHRTDYPLLKALESAHLAESTSSQVTILTRTGPITLDRNKKPCVNHHLLGGCTRPSCPKSHEPLTPQELYQLRKTTKRIPCQWVARGEPCDLGPELCPYGH